MDSSPLSALYDEEKTHGEVPDEVREAHERHLYDGFPDYHFVEPTTTNATCPSFPPSSVDDPRAPITRLFSQAPERQPEFQHPLTIEKTNAAVLVDFEGKDDPYRPINWTFRKKVMTTLLYGLTTMGATWGSSIYSSAIPRISEDFHVAKVVSTLGITLYLFGFGTGPMLWAPLSEVLGRRQAVFYPYFIGAIMAFGSATAKDYQTLMLTRFFGGFFSSAPVTNTGGVLGDLWSPAQRGPAMAAYAMAVAGGPLLGPIVGGAIVDSTISWRWTEYVSSDPEPV